VSADDSNSADKSSGVVHAHVSRDFLVVDYNLCLNRITIFWKKLQLSWYMVLL